APAIDACALSSRQREALRSAAQPIAKIGAHPGLESLEIPADSWADAYWVSTDAAKVSSDWFAWIVHRNAPNFASIRTRIEVPPGDTIAVDFARTERGSHTPSVEKHYDLSIDNGRYYVEPALLVPFVYHGVRTIDLAPTASGTERALGLRQDWLVTAAAMINVFPLGRQKGQLSSFRECRTRYCMENWLGVQFGTGLNAPLEDWYLGLVFEPISGLTLNAGGAMMKGEFLARGRAFGQLLPSSTAAFKHSDYMLRPYFGISFTLDILETLDRGTSTARRVLF
ncbi:MAG TPA: hypothetical protein VJT73_20995, partial [Polyangiaceae bacterium]|nr:hypothetical protein [Polyangiaceae bacterium]